MTRVLFVPRLRRQLAAAGLERLIGPLRTLKRGAWKLRVAFRAILAKGLVNAWRKRYYAKLAERRLEIGPGQNRLAGFETMDAIARPGIDYVLDLEKPLPFEDATFQLVYASHVLEHCPWFRTGGILRELVRIITPGGWLEVWLPDGLKIIETLSAAERGDLVTVPDGWAVQNPGGDPFLWVAGRLFYGANSDYPSWHRAIFTPRSLRRHLEEAGLVEVRQLSSKEVRGIDHGWINLGMTGRKPWTTGAPPT